MPGLIGSQGVRPGALNMNRVFRALRYRTEQAQKVTYHRPAIFDTDDYGVPSGTTAASPEILLPDLPAIIRPAVTADYQQQKQGSNIIGAARIYTPNITTIKNLPNFDQDNNTNFNEIEGWDRLITNYRTIYSAFTSGNTGSPTPWVNTGGNTPESDGESILISGASTAVTYKTTGNKNVLEADRLRFKIKTNDNNLVLASVVVTNTGAQTLTYTPSSLTVSQDSWLTVDIPFVSGTSATSIYQSGTRYATTVAGTFNYETNLDTIAFNWTGPEGDSKIVYLKEVEFYKSVSWHVHSLKDMTDGYIIFDCVRTRGRNDSRRRAYS